jgi:copper type II ascorbate-dependent monooxygenase-like protein
MAHLARWFILSLAAAAAVAACSGGDATVDGPKGGDGIDNPKAVIGPTFHKDVEPIVQSRCQKCHQPGGLAPFSLATYADAKAMAPAMKVETTARRMPPWTAHDSSECKPPLPWNHDERLTDVEIRTIADWDAAGAPEGDPKDAPPPAEIAPHELANPTLTLAPKSPWTASGDRDQFRCFVLDAPALSAGAYIGGMHIVPGNRKVVHHAVVFTDPDGKIAARAGADGSFDCSSVAMAAAGNGGGMNGPAAAQSVTLDVWTPGGNPVDLPPNIAMPLAAGSKLIMQIHYSPGGKQNDPDTTKVQVRVSTVKPEYLLFTTAVGNFPVAFNGEGLLPGPADPATGVEFRIPANARNHVEQMVVTVPPPAAGQPPTKLWLYGVMAHEHLAGVDVKFDLQRGASSQCLLQDKWDFHWQRMYTYAAPVEKLPTIEPGDKIRVRCTYDNSMANRRLSAEYRARGLQPVDLKLGEQTLDEMCLVIPQLLVKNP